MIYHLPVLGVLMQSEFDAHNSQYVFSLDGSRGVVKGGGYLA